LQLGLIRQADQELLYTFCVRCRRFISQNGYASGLRHSQNIWAETFGCCFGFLHLTLRNRFNNSQITSTVRAMGQV
jgi:hypothetical protein